MEAPVCSFCRKDGVFKIGQVVVMRLIGSEIRYGDYHAVFQCPRCCREQAVRRL